VTEMNAVARFFVNASARRRSARQMSWLQEVGVLRPGRYLELGAGHGDLAARIVEAVGPSEYIATDADPRQVEAARRTLTKRYPSGLPKSLELRAADMLALPFPDAAFDTVLALFVLHHASSHRGDFSMVPQALGEIDRVLRPGGWVVYEEFLHRAPIRDWFAARRYDVVRTMAHRKGEITALRKPVS
jgi:ubiquinone/menaquinone biosynthesis C-methylase UbiE